MAVLELDRWLVAEANVSQQVHYALAHASLRPVWGATDVAVRILYKACAQEAPGAACSHSADQHVLMFLGCRALTNTLGALRLLRAGYYLQALTVERDALETALLIHLFSEYPDEIAVWRDAPPAVRWGRFRPKAIGKKLSARGVWSRYEEEYGEYSELAGHPTPRARVVEWRSDLGRSTVGPFFEEDTAAKVLLRIRLNVCDACYHLLAALRMRDAFADDWRQIEEYFDEWSSSQRGQPPT